MSAKANQSGGAQMGYIGGESRNQRYLLPETIDDYIGADNPVRFVDAFVEKLDLEQLGFERAVAAETGRPGYDPGDLLRLYLYGYLNRIRSSRRLEREAIRNLELMWLLRRLRPDFKTIADFRRDNGRAIQQVCREFTLVCKDLDLFGGELVAIDGSKFEGVNSPSRNFSRKRLEERIAEIDAKIEAYLNQLDGQDREEASLETGKSDEFQQKLRRWQERKQRYQSYQQQLEQSGEKQISLTDPDSRRMSRGQGSQVGYNVQLAVDEKHKLIVEHEVTNAVTGPAGSRGRHGVLRRGRSQEVRGARHHSLHSQTQHLGQHEAGPVWEGAIPLRGRQRRLPLPGWPGVDLSVCNGRERPRDSLLLDFRVRRLRTQVTVHA
jgi:transposase